MVIISNKKVRIIQMKDVTMEYLCEFYEDECNRKIVLLIYYNDIYFSNIAYEEICNFADEKELLYFLIAYAKIKSVNGYENTKEQVETVFSKTSNVHYVLIKQEDKLIDIKGESSFYTDVIENEELYRENMKKMKGELNDKGIKAYLIRIPKVDELNSTAQHKEWRYGNFASKLNWSKAREEKIKTYLKKFTDLDYEDARFQLLHKENIKSLKERHGKTIFLVGPCIVGGWEAFSDETLGDRLFQELENLKLDYSVMNVVITRALGFMSKAVLEYDIRQNDIVLLIDDSIAIADADLDLAYVYNDYIGEQWLYADWPIHTTGMGNRLIARELVEKLIKPVTDVSKRNLDHKVLHEGVKQLTYEEDIILQQYLEELRKYSKKEYKTIGACVMTCSPFTKGHYHLIEYASRNVDFLYVFVVEDDVTYLRFKDRIEMVRRGVKNLKNVAVCRGGRFIATKDTFKNYFERDIYPDAIIDVTQDIVNFREYIAPALRISTRYIGEEPFDNITAQYNRALKEGLSEIMDVIEIPRIKSKEGVISAKRVRTYLETDNWEKVAEMVPDSTLEYLKNNIERMRKENAQLQNEKDNFDKVIKFMLDHDRIVICGLGKDADYLMEQLECRLGNNIIDGLIFYDQKADSVNYKYKNKKVIRFEELISTYKNYDMLIATRKFKKDIIFLLIRNNINPSKIKVFDGDDLLNA